MIHHHEFWWYFSPKKELNRIYLSLALRSFALSLIAIFVPLYLFQEVGLSLEKTLSFYLFYSIVFAIFTPIAAKFSARFGVKHSVLFSIPFYIIFVALLYLLPKYNIPLILLSTLVGVSLSFYWIGMHLIFYQASDRKHRGEEFGKRSSMMIFAAMIGPLIGGLLIKTIGFNLVFIIASVILILSAFILFMSKENHFKYRFSMKSIINKDHWKNSLFFVSYGAEVICNGVVWPLFIFMILKDYLSLGLVGSLLAGITALLVWGVGKFSDHVGKRKIIRWITGFESLSWFLRALVLTTTQVFFVTIYGAITRGIKTSPIGALEYDKAQDDATGYFVSREIFVCLGRILMVSLVMMTNSLTGGLIFQGFANFAALLF